MAKNWNLASVEPLDDMNYFIWSEKVEGILRAKRLWKKVMGVKPPEKPANEDTAKLALWNEWDDNNYTARAVMINTMSKAQLLKYSHEKDADKLWNLIKNNMAAQTEQLKARSLSELSNLRMNREESVDAFINRAEAYKNQCVQLGRNIEDYELKMYIIRGLRPEFDQNVRVLETQKELTVNDIRYALKQEESRKNKRKEEKRENDHVRKAREKLKYDASCYNCGMKGHMSNECRHKQKCFNCQGFNHIAADCKEPKKNTQRGRGYRGTSRGRGLGRGRERSEVTLKTSDEAVLSVRDRAMSIEENKQVGSKDCLWLLDSGATSHMAYDKVIFENLKNDKRDISLADREGEKLTSDGKGEIVIKQSSSDDRVRLKNVLCVPDINVNLLSVAKITDYGYNVTFNKHGATVYKERDEVKIVAIREENSYYVKSTLLNDVAAAAVEDLDIWHKRLGHANKRIIEDMKRGDLVIGMDKKDQVRKQCEPCIEGKMSRKTHSRLEERKARSIMDLWHVDLIGPIKPSSRGGKRYILTIIDDYSRVIFVEFLKEKKDAAEQLKKIIVLKKNQSGQKLKSLRSDNGGEFVGRDLEEWLAKKGIKHELSPPRTPQCNGVVERANRSIIEMTRTMMSDSRIPLDFWAEAMHTAVHIKNRIKSTVHGKTPYEMWNRKKPNIKYMRRFGCLAYVLEKEGGRRKFDPKVIKGIFVGYAANNTYRIYIPETGKIKTDCDVKFDESRDGKVLLENTDSQDQINNKNLIIIGLDPEGPSKEIQEEIQEEIEEEEEEGIEIESSDYEDAEMDEATQNGSYIKMDKNTEEIQAQPVEVRNRGRPRGTTKAEMEARRQMIREERREEQGNARRSERIKEQQRISLVMDGEIPKNVKEAKGMSDWKYWDQAMREEIASMEEHKVWDIVPRPKDKKVIRSKWVFDIKEDPNTEQRRYKARLVAMGCSQRPGVDYEETFAPVVRSETIRLIFSISAQKKRKVKVYDVKTAFLHGSLKEEIFMEVPDGLQCDQDQVCKLKKSIYGLKQAGKCWNEFLTKILTICGLKQSKEDSCLFFARETNKFMFCAIHVDDMTIVASDDKLEKSFMDKIKKYVDIKDLGEARTVLGMQIDQSERGVFVHQKKYIEKLLILYGMEDCNSVVTPIDINVKLDEYNGSNTTDVIAYQELLGRLMYLSICTRPDLSFALSCLSQYNNEPRVLHMSALKRILRYLKGTIDYGLEYGRKGSDMMIKCETDASWDKTRDAKSFTGLLVYRNGDLIHWKSKKQTMVALSSTESEIEAMMEGLKETIWIYNLSQEIGMGEGMSKELKCDNLNAVRLANGGNFKTKSKLMNRRCHYIQEAVRKENIHVSHVPNEKMTADCLTKPLSGAALLKNVTRFMATKIDKIKEANCGVNFINDW